MLAGQPSIVIATMATQPNLEIESESKYHITRIGRIVLQVLNVLSFRLVLFLSLSRIPFERSQQYRS